MEYNPNRDTIKEIEKCRQMIADNEVQIKNIQFLNSCLMDRMLSNIYCLCGFTYNWNNIIEYIQGQRTKENKSWYDSLCHTLINTLFIDDNKYNKKRLIEEVLIEGYGAYGHNIYFTVNGIHLSLTYPEWKNISKHNIEYAIYGQYVLFWRKTENMSNYIGSSYNLDDLKGMLQKFLQEQEKK